MSVSARTRKRTVKRVSKINIAKPKEALAENLGLCSTCNNVANCGFLRANGQPIVFCEEFDSIVPTVSEEVVSEHFPTVEEMREWDEYKGLCINCDNRKDCAIRNREIGVWHCEEYR